MKKCPNCGAVVSPNDETCRNCSASLEGVHAVEIPGDSEAPPDTILVAPPQPVREPGGGRSIGILVLVLILLAGGGYILWRYVLRPQGPLNAVRGFMRAAAAGDVDGAKKHLSRASLSLLQRAEAYGIRLKASDLSPVRSGGRVFEEGKQYVLKLVQLRSTWARVNMKPGPTPVPGFDKDDVAAFKDGCVPFIVVRDDRGWKVDLMASAAAAAVRPSVGGG